MFGKTTAQRAFIKLQCVSVHACVSAVWQSVCVALRIQTWMASLTYFFLRPNSELLLSSQLYKHFQGHCVFCVCYDCMVMSVLYTGAGLYLK